MVTLLVVPTAHMSLRPRILPHTGRPCPLSHPRKKVARHYHHRTSRTLFPYIFFPDRRRIEFLRQFYFDNWSLKVWYNSFGIITNIQVSRVPALHRKWVTRFSISSQIWYFCRLLIGLFDTKAILENSKQSRVATRFWRQKTAGRKRWVCFTNLWELLRSSENLWEFMTIFQSLIISDNFFLFMNF